MGLNWDSVGEGYPETHQDDELVVLTQDTQMTRTVAVYLEQEAILTYRELEYAKAFADFRNSTNDLSLLLGGRSLAK